DFHVTGVQTCALPISGDAEAAAEALVEAAVVDVAFWTGRSSTWTSGAGEAVVVGASDGGGSGSRTAMRTVPELPRCAPEPSKRRSAGGRGGKAGRRRS